MFQPHSSFVGLFVVSNSGVMTAIAPSFVKNRKCIIFMASAFNAFEYALKQKNNNWKGSMDKSNTVINHESCSGWQENLKSIWSFQYTFQHITKKDLWKQFGWSIIMDELCIYIRVSRKSYRTCDIFSWTVPWVESSAGVSHSLDLAGNV